MVRCLLLACGLSLLQGTVRADDRVLWVGQSPCLILVHEVDKASSSLVFRQADTNILLSEKEYQVSIDGKIETRKVPYYQSVCNRPSQVRFSLKDTKVYDNTGTLLDEADILKRARPGMGVVIARMGDKFDPHYLFVFKKETLIVVVPADREVPRPEPLPVSFVIPALGAFAEVCDDLLSRRFIRFAF
jgi:hypothetical protein